MQSSGRRKQPSTVRISKKQDALHCSLGTPSPEPKYGWDRTYMFLFALFRSGRLSTQRKAVIDIVTGYLKSDYDLAVEDGPYFWLGALMFEEGQFDTAFENLQQAVQISHGRCFREEDPRYREIL